MYSGTRGERRWNTTTEAGGSFYKPTSARHPTNPRSWARSRTPILHQLRRNQTLGHRELGPPASRNPFMALGPTSSGTLLHKASCAGATWPWEQPPGQTLDTKALRAALLGNTVCVVMCCRRELAQGGPHRTTGRAAGRWLTPALAHTLPVRLSCEDLFTGRHSYRHRAPEFCDSFQ